MISATVKIWLYAILGSVLAVLGVRNVYLSKKAKQLKTERNTLKATVNAERVRKNIVKKQREELSRRESEIKKEIKDDKVPDNLTDSNNW